MPRAARRAGPGKKFGGCPERTFQAAPGLCNSPARGSSAFPLFPFAFVRALHRTPFSGVFSQLVVRRAGAGRFPVHIPAVLLVFGHFCFPFPAPRGSPASPPAPARTQRALLNVFRSGSGRPLCRRSALPQSERTAFPEKIDFFRSVSPHHRRRETKRHCSQTFVDCYSVHGNGKSM